VTSLRKAVEELGRFFRREFHYDFPQYYHLECDNLGRAFLWASPLPRTAKGRQMMVYGACGFHWDKWENYRHGWSMSWCWFHPYERRQGHLLDVWPYFRARFPGFICVPPFSISMIKFLFKVGHLDEHPVLREGAMERLLKGTGITADHG
jgi:hypothetical protein